MRLLRPRLPLFFILSAFSLIVHLRPDLFAAGTPPIAGAVKGVAEAEIVRLHQVPDASSEAVGAVARGETLWLVPSVEDWCRVVTEDGVRGWAPKAAFALAPITSSEIPVMAVFAHEEGVGYWHALLGKEGWLTPRLNEILPPDADSPGAPFYATGPNDTRFYLNERGEQLTLPDHRPEGPFRYGLARVRLGNTAYGFVDKSLNLVIPAVWSTAGNFSDGVVYVVDDLDFTQSYLDTSGKTVLQMPEGIQLSADREFGEGLVAFEGEGQRHGFLDRQGRRVLEPVWTLAGVFRGGFCQVSESDFLNGEPLRPFYIDRSGKALQSDQWVASGDFAEGRAVVHFPAIDAYQYIDASGKVLGGATAIYVYADAFSEGLAAVANEDGLFGYINAEGHEHIAPQFDWASAFTRGHAWVEMEGRYALIDKTGQPVTAWFEPPAAAP